MIPVSLSDWLFYIESLHPQEIDLSLDRVSTVARAAGLIDSPDFTCPIVLVGGTNGKGSTVSTLAILLRAKGLQVGAYFSPHLFKFNERIQIDGQCIADDQLCQVFSHIENNRLQCLDSEAKPISLTFFEFTTLAALQFFKIQHCDIVVLEVGLGGRLDAVNIVTPVLSIITTLGLDHTDRLGDSLDQIAVEKAGILRKDVPAFIGKPACHPALLKEAARIDAQVIPVEEHCFTKINIPPLSLSLALAALQYLTPLFAQRLEDTENKPNDLERLLKDAPLPGRFQQQRVNINQAGTMISAEIIFDVAHNPLGAQWLSHKLNTNLRLQAKNQIKSRQNIGLWSSFKDKDLKGIVEAMKHDIALWVIAPLDHPRAASIEDLRAALISQGVQKDFIFCTPTIVAAYHKACTLLGPEAQDQMIVFGSFGTVSELSIYLAPEPSTMLLI